ncbi:L-ornithine 5-monooxygenase domain protein [Burkholderia pseudomallei]|nr:L-ornithine 5-monooxygenase domain protein [Burkholderia pseudomallei]
MWCVVSTNQCVAASSRIRCARTSGPCARSNGSASSRSAMAAARCSRDPALASARSVKRHGQRIGACTVCSTPAAPSANVVRSASWRAISASHDNRSAFASSPPSRRSRSVMWYAADSPSRRACSQRRVCANDAGTLAARSSRGGIGSIRKSIPASPSFARNCLRCVSGSRAKRAASDSRSGGVMRAPSCVLLMRVPD